jgi:hypothetical protein
MLIIALALRSRWIRLPRPCRDDCCMDGDEHHVDKYQSSRMSFWNSQLKQRRSSNQVSLSPVTLINKATSTVPPPPNSPTTDSCADVTRKKNGEKLIQDVNKNSRFWSWIMPSTLLKSVYRKLMANTFIFVSCQATTLATLSTARMVVKYLLMDRRGGSDSLHLLYRVIKKGVNTFLEFIFIRI